MQKYLKSEEEGKPRVYGVSSVNQFVELVTGFDPHKIFRGQTKEKDWPLIPFVGRYVGRSRFLKKEEEILEEFKRESIPYVDPKPENPWQWLALAQHNKLPTRLLDWTKNPLAALWFAVKDPALNNNPGVVWVFYYHEDEAIFNTSDRDTLNPFSIDRTYVYFPEHVTPSIKAQSGVFTVHHRIGENPGSFPPLEQISNPNLYLTKIEIAPDFFSVIRYHLFKVGISPASLYPGLSGLVEKICYDNILCKDEDKP